MMNFVGKKFLFRYESGLEVTGDYMSSTELSWEALTGPSRGAKGVETIYASEVAHNIYFISWLEKSGVSVSQVLDLNRSQVTAFITFDAGEVRQSLFDRGTLTESPGGIGRE